ncbi:MAG: hypothetical protein ACPGF7_03865 [Pontibacterium sp.]
MQTEKIQNRIETYTSNLTQAVQGGSGAQFSMLLSMISTNQDLFAFNADAQGGNGFELPEAALRYPGPNEFYNGEMVERLNISVNQHLRGEFAYINSYVETGARTPVNARRANDAFEKVALLTAGNSMLGEIEASRNQIRHTV